MKPLDKAIVTATRKSRLVKPHIQQTKKEEVQTAVKVETNLAEATLPKADACNIGKFSIFTY